MVLSKRRLWANLGTTTSAQKPDIFLKPMMAQEMIPALHPDLKPKNTLSKGVDSNLMCAGGIWSHCFV